MVTERMEIDDDHLYPPFLSIFGLVVSIITKPSRRPAPLAEASSAAAVCGSSLTVRRGNAQSKPPNLPIVSEVSRPLLKIVREKGRVSPGVQQRNGAINRCVFPRRPMQDACSGCRW